MEKKGMVANEEHTKKGVELMKKLWGVEYTEQLLGPFKSAEDDWELEVVGFSFGNIYQRPHLDFKTRAMLTIAMLIAQFDTSTESIIRAWMRAAPNVGITEEELREIAIHACQYCGFPKSRLALKMAKEVFAEYRAKKKITLP